MKKILAVLMLVALSAPTFANNVAYVGGHQPHHRHHHHSHHRHHHHR